MPPISLPLILPKLNAIPIIKLPAGSKDFGNKSTIKEIPKENNDPTSIPARVNKIDKAIIELSRKAAHVKQIAPVNKTDNSTFFRPKRSLNIPNGSCESKLQAAKHGIMSESISTSEERRVGK